jgi:hypothetical protein
MSAWWGQGTKEGGFTVSCCDFIWKNKTIGIETFPIRTYEAMSEQGYDRVIQHVRYQSPKTILTGKLSSHIVTILTRNPEK